jgi:hypothetical protein
LLQAAFSDALRGFPLWAGSAAIGAAAAAPVKFGVLPFVFRAGDPSFEHP